MNEVNESSDINIQLLKDMQKHYDLYKTMPKSLEKSLSRCFLAFSTKKMNCQITEYQQFFNMDVTDIINECNIMKERGKIEEMISTKQNVIEEIIKTFNNKSWSEGLRIITNLLKDIKVLDIQQIRCLYKQCLSEESFIKDQDLILLLGKRVYIEYFVAYFFLTFLLYKDTLEAENRLQFNT